MNLEYQRCPILRDNPSQTIADKANRALQLFAESRDIAFQDEITTTTEPPRSTKITTVERQAGLMTRAITLTTLAAENLAFFKNNALLREGGEEAEAAVRELGHYFQQNKKTFTETFNRNKAFLKGELERTQEEFDFLKAAFRKTELPEEQAAIEGRINITNLRILRLQRVSEDNNRILAFLE